MKDKKFEIVGEVENIDIPDVEEETPETSGRNGEQGAFKFRVNKDKISEFIKNMRDNSGKLPMPSKSDLEKLAKQSNISTEQIESMVKNIKEFMDESIDEGFIEELERILEDKGSSVTQEDIDRQFDKLFEGMRKSSDNEDQEEEDGFEIEVSEDRDSLLDYSTLYDGETYGMVAYERSPRLLEEFKEKYGDLERYDVKIFVPEIKVSNATPGLANIRSIDLVESNDKYILFRGIPGYQGMEPMYIAIIKFQGEFEIVIPEYGNSFEIATGDLFDHKEDAELFLDTPMGKVLMRPADISKMKTGLDLVLFEPRKPMFSIRDFGSVIVDPAKSEFASEYIHIGDIISNESEGARLFKKDFDIPEDSKSLKFFVKLKREYPEDTLNTLSNYISDAIDFNENSKVIMNELKYSSSGRFAYIEIDLGDLPDNIDRWSEE